MKYTTRITQITVLPEGKDVSIIDENATRIELEDDGCREYVTIRQLAAPVAIDAENWPAIRDAIEVLLLHKV